MTEGIVRKLSEVLGRMIELSLQMTRDATVEVGGEKFAVMPGQRRLVGGGGVRAGLGQSNDEEGQQDTCGPRSKV